MAPKGESLERVAGITCAGTGVHFEACGWGLPGREKDLVRAPVASFHRDRQDRETTIVSKRGGVSPLHPILGAEGAKNPRPSG